ncbi:MAG: hypothetical protein NT178_17870, partial [Proteobacteria bacterium]|nr:hypothetical protein [Pseudomonadota bacterium]
SGIPYLCYPEYPGVNPIHKKTCKGNVCAIPGTINNRPFICKMYLRPRHLFYETGENPEGTNLHNEDMLRTNTGLGSNGIRATGR